MKTTLPDLKKINQAEKSLSHIEDLVDKGYLSELEALIYLKNFIKKASIILKNIEDIAFFESEKYTGSEFIKNGFKIQKRYGGRVFDFKHIDEWRDAKDSLKKIEEKYKNAFLASEKGINSITKDGEILQMPNVSYRKDSLIISKDND